MPSGGRDYLPEKLEGQFEDHTGNVCGQDARGAEGRVDGSLCDRSGEGRLGPPPAGRAKRSPLEGAVKTIFPQCFLPGSSVLWDTEGNPQKFPSGTVIRP